MGARIKARRVALEMNQAELGKRVGIGKGMISAIETGRFMPSVTVLAELGKVLGCGADVLLYGAGEAATLQSVLPGMSLDDRINALPEGLREFVLLSLKRAEHAKARIPAQFLKPPTNENWPQFAAYLEAISLINHDSDD